jgi:hypothetical protein
MQNFFKDEGLSGATTNCPALLRCLKALEDGDTLIVWKLDRLGRRLRDLIAILDDLPGWCERERVRTTRTRFLQITGPVQNQDAVVHFKAQQVQPLEITQAAIGSRNFH